MRILTPADAHALGLYCMALAEYVQASKLVAEQGLVVPGREGGNVANPVCRIERDRWMMVLRMGAELGLTPSSRTRLEVQPALNDPMEILLS